MNMLLHGIKYNDFDIRNGDTLAADDFGDQQFDAVVANPPFSADWSDFNNGTVSVSPEFSCPEI